MLLLSYCISFTNPGGNLRVKFRQRVEPKRVQVISRREGFDSRKPRMLNAARKDKMTNQMISSHLHGDE